ncbi:MAG: hypothetical protein U0169_01955 [Polyangiaceae bacterium]
MSDERRRLYEADILRLEEQITDIERSRKSLVWVLLGGIVLAPVGWYFSTFAGLGLLIAGLSIFGCGHYIILMHVIEWRDSVRRNRAILDEMDEAAGTPAAPELTS